MASFWRYFVAMLTLDKGEIDYMDEKETFAGEIAKQLPVKDIYNDLAHPALSTVGQGLQGVTKLALAPISALVWGYDKIAGYLDVAIPEYFEKRKISKEKIVSPDPAIAVPTVEAMRYTSHKEELREMFTNLLGASMNADSIDEHPAFVNIIKQLSSDESKIIKYLYHDDRQPMIKIRIKVDESAGERDLLPYFSDIGYIAHCQYPQKFPEYLDNLHRLGIVEVYYDRFLVDDKYYEKLKLHPQFPHVEGKGNIVEKKSMYELSEFGKKFCKVCLS